jgi:hypothetical protein
VGTSNLGDGKKPGLQIIVAGGEHGDVPLEPTSGELIANLIVDKGVSMVIDISLMRKGEQKRFMIDFAETLYHKNRRRCTWSWTKPTSSHRSGQWATTLECLAP